MLKSTPKVVALSCIYITVFVINAVITGLGTVVPKKSRFTPLNLTKTHLNKGMYYIDFI